MSVLSSDHANNSSRDWKDTLCNWQFDSFYKYIFYSIFTHTMALAVQYLRTELYFDVLLTVHCSNDQFWFQLMHHNFTLLTKPLYMFRAPTCPSSGGQTINTPQLVQLHLLWRLCGRPYSRHKRWSWTSCVVCIVCPPEDGHVGARNM